MDEATRVRNKINDFQTYTFSRCNRPKIKVACILDTFSYECFKYEATFEQLRSDTWKKQMEGLKPHLLFVESAWRGVDNTWWGALFNRGNRVIASQKEFYELMAYCKSEKIKTVFWNKEDPINYKFFISSAKLFDYIFTTDEDCISNYVRDVGHKRVYVLPFAAQPVIHNPVNSTYSTKEKVAFAGTWYASDQPERQADLRLVLAPAQEFDLHIFDRMSNFSGNQCYRFPEEYQKHIIGELSYDDMLKAYKLYKVFLNVNSTKKSQTMFSRRVFEILAAGTNILSTYSKGMKGMFGTVVCFSSSVDETKKHLVRLLRDPEYSKRLSLQGIRAVHAQHTYQHRFNTILVKTGLKSSKHIRPGVSMVIIIEYKGSLDTVLKCYKNQNWRNKELIVITKYGGTEEWERVSQAYPGVTMYQMPTDREFSMGERLNFAVTNAKHKYISIINERDDYGDNYLVDLMNAFQYTDADIVGKSCYYVYSEDCEAILLSNCNQEYKFTDDLSDSAIIIKKRVFDHIKFPSRSEGACKEFLIQCSKKGYKLFSADKYNYVHRVKELGQIKSTDQLIGRGGIYQTFYDKWIGI